MGVSSEFLARKCDSKTLKKNRGKEKEEHN